MKKLVKVIAFAMAIVTLTCLLASCGALSGKYEGLTVQFEFKGSKVIISSKLLNLEVEGKYSIDGDKINGAIAAKKYRTTYSQSFANPLQFVGEGQQINLVNGTKAKQLTVKFGAHTTQFVYNAQKQLYMRWQNSEKHIDGVTGEQLGFENVIVLFCPYTLTQDDYHHIEVTTTGKGKGYYLTGGKKVDIQWSKSSGDAQVKLYYPSGKALTLTPGKTNIEIVGYESATSIIEE